MSNVIALNNTYFEELSHDDMLLVAGGSFWGAVGAGAAIVGGAAGIVGGVAALAAPEPTGLTKVAGWAAIVAGTSAIVGGVAYFAE